LKVEPELVTLLMFQAHTPMESTKLFFHSTSLYLERAQVQQVTLELQLTQCFLSLVAFPLKLGKSFEVLSSSTLFVLKALMEKFSGKSFVLKIVRNALKWMCTP
jgi:hypothetical protein